MIEFLKNLLNLNTALLGKVRSVQAYDEAMALYTAKEYSNAIPLLKEASELGNVQAMSVYGGAYLLGKGVKENGVEAEKWLQRAIDGGHVDAESVLGMALATGKAGVKVDIDRASRLLAKAADSGDSHAAEMLEMIQKRKGMFKNLRR